MQTVLIHVWRLKRKKEDQGSLKKEYNPGFFLIYIFLLALEFMSSRSDWQNKKTPSHPPKPRTNEQPRPSWSDKHRNHFRRGGGRREFVDCMLIFPAILVGTFNRPYLVTNKQTPSQQKSPAVKCSRCYLNLSKMTSLAATWQPTAFTTCFLIQTVSQRACIFLLPSITFWTENLIRFSVAILRGSMVRLNNNSDLFFLAQV